MGAWLPAPRVQRAWWRRGRGRSGSRANSKRQISNLKSQPPIPNRGREAGDAQYEIRNTRYAIRDTRSATPNSLPDCNTRTTGFNERSHARWRLAVHTAILGREEGGDGVHETVGEREDALVRLRVDGRAVGHGDVHPAGESFKRALRAG